VRRYECTRERKFARYDAGDKDLLDAKINFASWALGNASQCLFCKSGSLSAGLLVDTLEVWRKEGDPN
jgi:hypothetical protein